MGGAGRVIDRWEVPWDNPSSDQLARPVGNDCLGSGESFLVSPVFTVSLAAGGRGKGTPLTYY